MSAKPLVLVALVALAPMAVLAEQQAPTSRLPAGYLTSGQMPDSVALVAPPPAEGSRALKNDHKAEAAALSLRGTARWELARSDADLFTPNATATMSCAAGLAIGPRNTPKLDALLRKSAADFGMVSAATKARYGRDRPFVGNGQPICTPEQEQLLRGNGSYPSGHATIGFGWALVLADLVPQRRSRLLARGRQFADSRLVCNVHFRSDVEAGMALAQPVLVRLRQNPAYQADLAVARAEIRAMPKAPIVCAAETAALRLN